MKSNHLQTLINSKNPNMKFHKSQQKKRKENNKNGKEMGGRNNFYLKQVVQIVKKEKMKKFLRRNKEKKKLLKFLFDSFTALCTRNRESISNIKNCSIRFHLHIFFSFSLLSSCSSLQSLCMIVMWRWNNSLIMNFILIFLSRSLFIMLQWLSEIDFYWKKYCLVWKSLLYDQDYSSAFYFFLYLSANMTKSSYLNLNKGRISIDHLWDEIKLRFVIESQIFGEFPLFAWMSFNGFYVAF